MVALVLSTTTGSNWMLFAKSNTLRLSLRCLWMCLCQSDFRNLCVSTRPSPRCLLGPRRHKTLPCRRVQHPGTEHDIANGQKWVEHCMHPTPPVVPPQVRYDWTRQWHPPQSHLLRFGTTGGLGYFPCSRLPHRLAPRASRHSTPIDVAGQRRSGGAELEKMDRSKDEGGPS